MSVSWDSFEFSLVWYNFIRVNCERMVKAKKAKKAKVQIRMYKTCVSHRPSVQSKVLINMWLLSQLPRGFILRPNYQSKSR